jgi:hypothetical protein
VLPAGSDFTARVKTGFPSVGIFGGLLFGGTGGSDGYAFLLADSATGNGTAQNRTFKIVQVEDGSQSTVYFPAANSLPAVECNRFYEMKITGTTGSAQIIYTITDLSNANVIVNETLNLPTAFTSGSRFGVAANASNSSLFDDFEVTFEPVD